MGKRVNYYQEGECTDPSSGVHEDVTAYLTATNSAHVCKMSIRQALQTGMLLEKSRGLMAERIHKDFPNIEF